MYVYLTHTKWKLSRTNITTVFVHSFRRNVLQHNEESSSSNWMFQILYSLPFQISVAFSPDLCITQIEYALERPQCYHHTYILALVRYTALSSDIYSFIYRVENLPILRSSTKIFANDGMVLVIWVKEEYAPLVFYMYSTCVSTHTVMFKWQTPHTPNGYIGLKRKNADTSPRRINRFVPFA